MHYIFWLGIIRSVRRNSIQYFNSINLFNCGSNRLTFSIATPLGRSPRAQRHTPFIHTPTVYIVFSIMFRRLTTLFSVYYVRSNEYRRSLCTLSLQCLFLSRASIYIERGRLILRIRAMNPIATRIFYF